MSDYARRTARVLLIDSGDRLLLMKTHLRPADPAAGEVWVLPGGGVEAGETLVQAAARELQEEIGLKVSPEVLSHVAYSSGRGIFGLGPALYRDDFFVHRVRQHAVDTAGMERAERAQHLGQEWWSVAQLEATDELVYPVGLAGLFSAVLAGGDFEEPVVLPW